MARRAWKAFVLSFLVPQILLHPLLYRFILHFSNNGVLTLPTGNTAHSWTFTKVFDLLWWDWSCSSFHSLVLIFFSHVATHQSTPFFSWQFYRSLNPWVSSTSGWTSWVSPGFLHGTLSLVPWPFLVPFQVWFAPKAEWHHHLPTFSYCVYTEAWVQCLLY